MCVRRKKKKPGSEVNNKNRRITDRRELRKVPTVARSYWQVGHRSRRAMRKEPTEGEDVTDSRPGAGLQDMTRMGVRYGGTDMRIAPDSRHWVMSHHWAPKLHAGDTVRLRSGGAVPSH